MHRPRSLAGIGGSVAITVWLLAGPIAPMTAAQPSPLDGTAWVLASLAGQQASGTNATMRFEGGRATGSDGCNRFSTTYTASGASLQFAPSGISTQMACPAPVMKQAAAFTNAMSRTRNHRIQAGQLQLLGEDGGVLATFDPQSLTLAGSSWEVTGFNNGRQAVVSPVIGTMLTMTFGADGTLSGSAGCNGYSAAFTSTGTNVTINPPVATRKLCTTPAGVMEQEQQFLQALPTARIFRMEGDRLDLRTADDGALVVTANRRLAK